MILNFFNFKCRDCGETWESETQDTMCPECLSSNIIPTDH